MNRSLRNALAVVAGFVAANLVIMVVTMSSGYVVAPPAGADMNSAEGLRAAMPRMTPLHFLMPFLAHALGALTGGLVAARAAASHRMNMALVLGGIFFVIGVVMVKLVGGPLWFIALDLVVAYVPMAWLGGKLGLAISGGARPAPAPALSH
jgi:hypothetical protein